MVCGSLGRKPSYQQHLYLSSYGDFLGRYLLVSFGIFWTCWKDTKRYLVSFGIFWKFPKDTKRYLVSFGIFWYLFNRFKRYQKIPKDTSRYHKIPHDTTWYHKILFFETNLFKAIWRDSSAYTAFGLRPCLSFWQHGQGNHRSSRQPASTSVAWQPARPWGVQHWGDSARHSDGRASGAPSCPRRSKHARAAWKWLGAAAVGSWVGERDGWGTWDVCRTTQSQSCLGSCSGC